MMTIGCNSKFHLFLTDSTAITSLSYGEGAGPYLLSQITCIGTERILTACSYQNSQIGFHICSSGQDAGVRCDGEIS